MSSKKEKDISCHLNVHDPEIENNWQKTLEFIQRESQWLVDQFFHVNEKVVDIEEIQSLAECAEMRITRWFNVKENLSDYIDDDRVESLYNNLQERDQLIVKDLLLKPDYYTVGLENK